MLKFWVCANACWVGVFVCLRLETPLLRRFCTAAGYGWDYPDTECRDTPLCFPEFLCRRLLLMLLTDRDFRLSPAGQTEDIFTKSLQATLWNQLLWQCWNDFHWIARLKGFGCLFSFHCHCPPDAPTGFLWFKVNVFMTAKFYLMQQKLQGGFGPKASISVTCRMHILFPESYLSILLNTKFGNPTGRTNAPRLDCEGLPD